MALSVSRDTVSFKKPGALVTVSRQPNRSAEDQVLYYDPRNHTNYREKHVVRCNQSSELGGRIFFNETAHCV